MYYETVSEQSNEDHSHQIDGQKLWATQRRVRGMNLHQASNASTKNGRKRDDQSTTYHPFHTHAVVPSSLKPNNQFPAKAETKQPHGECPLLKHPHHAHNEIT
jgi:hypothetical protein